jgi:hypothetical protein
MNNKHFTSCMLLLVVLSTVPSAKHAAAVADEKTTTRGQEPKLSAAQGSVDLAGIAVRRGDAREPVMRPPISSRLYDLATLEIAKLLTLVAVFITSVVSVVTGRMSQLGIESHRRRSY